MTFVVFVVNGSKNLRLRVPRGFEYAIGAMEEDHGFAVNVSARGRVFVNPAFRDAVEELSLSRFAEAMGFVGGEEVDRNRARSVVRVRFGGGTFFLKRFTRPPAKDAWPFLVRFRGPEAPARREWEAIRALGRAGIRAPEVAAMGEAAGGWLRRPSFLLTADLEGFVSLREGIATGGLDLSVPSRRRPLLEALAGTVRRMHDAGITHPDLFAHHVFVREAEGAFEFALIDLHRSASRSWVSLFDAVRDLTGLHLTTPPSRTDRVRFLRAYFGSDRLGPAAKRLARKVEKRAARIGSRRKFRG